MGTETYRCSRLGDLSPDLGRVVRRAEASATSHNEILSYWDGIAAWEISGNAMHRAVQKVLLANGDPKQALDAAGAEVDMATAEFKKS